jgi:hypothetical protein
MGSFVHLGSGIPVWNEFNMVPSLKMGRMNEVTSRRIHESLELLVCLWVMSPPSRSEFGTCQILNSFLSKRERGGWECTKVVRGKYCKLCLHAPGDLLHGEDSRCSLKWDSWHSNPLCSIEKAQVALSPEVTYSLTHLWKRLQLAQSKLKPNKGRGFISRALRRWRATCD